MSEDVSKFLEQVKELGDRRVEEDEARSKELEEKILQDRKERQARREERARSISPQKSSPANTPPPPSAHRISVQGPERLNFESSPTLDPPTSPQTGDLPDSDPMHQRDSFSDSASKENESPFDTDNKRSSGAISPTRTNSTARGLNWQKRPNSQASSSSRSRPLSMVAAENAARSSTTPSELSPTTDAASRDQIAQSLSSKDPSWFRQTAGRGTSSGAYRKNHVEDAERVDMSSMKAQLPGMARRPSAEHPKEDSGSRPGSPASRSLGPPLPLTSSQKLDPLGNDGQKGDENVQERHGPMSPPPLGRSSPTRTDRPVSPTKGMGGFVQSAMMKRSDSVNKRWSVQPTGLQRADSVVSNRSSYDPTNRASVGTKPRPISMFQEPSLSAEPSSRPNSSQGKDEKQDESISAKINKSLKVHITHSPEPQAQDAEKVTPPSSPSKTMDQRRWSPTKSSWLESALNKPESPKPKPIPAPSNQPAWMAELAKAKAQKAANPSADLERKPTVSHKHEVSIGGLMRSTAPGTAAKSAALASAGRPITPTSGSVRNPSQSSVAGGDGEVESMASSKPKPETPPKVDFRANLKSRPPPPSGGTGEPEFKNVFGRLRSTTTQNYVAPDELKNNILRGKAGLNVTGGPKKTERKDEFKEAILAKKQDFQKTQAEGRGISRNSSTASEKPVPEGLVRAMDLGRSSTVKRGSVTSDIISPTESNRSSTVSKRDSISQTTPTFSERPSSSDKREPAVDHSSMETRRPSLGGNRLSSVDQNSMETRRPSLGVNQLSSNDTSLAKTTGEPPAISAAQKETSAPGRLPGKLAGSALANRFNPALAGMLARGPPPMASGSSSITGSSATASSSDNGAANEPGPAPKLTHMTKGRARGPKRNGPTSATAPAAPTAATRKDEVEAKIPSPRPLLSAAVSEKKPTPVTSPRPDLPSPGFTDKRPTSVTSPKPDLSSPGFTEKPTSVTSPKPEIISLVDSSKRSYENSRPKPQAISLIDSSKIISESAAPVKPPESPSKKHLRSPSKKIHEQVAAFAAQGNPPSPTKARDEAEQGRSQPSSPKKLNLNRMSQFLDQSKQVPDKAPEAEKAKDVKNCSDTAETNTNSVASRVSSPGIQKLEVRSPPPEIVGSEPANPVIVGSKPSTPGLQKIESKSPTLKSVGSPPPEALPSPKKEVANDPVGSMSSAPDEKTPSMFGSRPIPSLPPAAASESSKPLPRPLPEEATSSRPILIPGRATPPSVSPIRSPTKQAMEVTSVLNEFFGPNRPKREYHVDAAELLMNRPATSAPKIQTLSMQLFRFSADGKKVAVPAHHERVLFEREMYLCSHTFNNEPGKKTSEVYFWTGDEVGSSTVEEASVFATREAKSLGGKLVKLRQGKETPELMAALGGILITRRGSSNKYDSLAPHMMCGRRYLGQVVFDEVDFTPAALCSGFPYIITNVGRCYLWKGKGSGVDELGCARLIGMDYALSGELQEVEDGREPANFWDLFGGGAKSSSADHWRLKPNYDKYGSRLFCSDAASKQQIVELSPFSQTDLEPTGIYVLDAFFELYIVVGSRAQPQYASFHNALDFAQEYAILAAGMEDRPFVPISTVVLEGIPKDMKSVFRKWRDADSPTITNAPGSGTGLRRGRSLRVVPLTQALQALSE